jgi:hypothetical protein
MLKMPGPPAVGHIGRKMKSIKDLFEPSNDAIDYNNTDKREYFKQTYFSTQYFEKLRQRNCYYIIGEKGSGKTALALFYKINAPENSTSQLLPISITQYKKFIALRKNKKLEYSDYSSIWRTTLCMLVSQEVVKNNKKWIHRITGKFKKIEDAIKNYDETSLLPEIDTAIELASALSQNAEFFPVEGNKSKLAFVVNDSRKENSTEIRMHLLESEKILKSGLKDIKLENDFVLFLDGLDSRPNDVEKKEFKECLQGLNDAMWQLNTEFFSQLKDTVGKMRVCILIRPDVFEWLDIPNSNSRVNDNSVVLNWETTEDEYKNSPLFYTVNKYFTGQNDSDENLGWNAYFPYFSDKRKSEIFIFLLKGTFIRPRDYFTAIKYLRKIYVDNKSNATKFEYNDIFSRSFSRDFSNYLLSEVKNYFNFYMSNEDYSEYINFFQFLDGSSTFDYEEYKEAFENYCLYIEKREIENKYYCEDPDNLLQLLFDVNIVGYIDDPKDKTKSFIHWAYRERSLSNLRPKIKIPSNYIVFSGIMKSIDIGKRFIRK